MSILQTIDLKKYYGTEPNITRALDGVNFSVNDGEFVAVVGTSGSGKDKVIFLRDTRCGRRTCIPNFMENFTRFFNKFLTFLRQEPIN